MASTMQLMINDVDDDRWPRLEMFPFWWLCHGRRPVSMAGALEVAIEIITPHHRARRPHGFESSVSYDRPLAPT